MVSPVMYSSTTAEVDAEVCDGTRMDVRLVQGGPWMALNRAQQNLLLRKIILFSNRKQHRSSWKSMLSSFLGVKHLYSSAKTPLGLQHRYHESYNLRGGGGGIPRGHGSRVSRYSQR